MPSWYAWATLPAALAWTAGAWSAAIYPPPAQWPAIWTGIGPATYWADWAMYWGLRAC